MMVIDGLELQGFRNYAAAAADFDREINVITGNNAQGKTNLLEAIYVLCTGKSFRARSDRELLGFTEDGGRLYAHGCAGDRERRVEIRLHRGRRREMTVNGVKQKTAQAFAGCFAAVLFCPEDLELIRGGAAERRRFLDNCISQLRPRYAAALYEFGRAYEAKTRILRDMEEKPSLEPLLEEYNLRLARMSAELIHYRALFLDALGPECARIHGEFSGGERLELAYTTVSTVDDPRRPVEELTGLIMEHQERHRAAEIASRLCLTGAHKDDIEISINGARARTFASQGQTRTAALSMKLAELELHRKALGEYPLLLLDDVLSELDAARQDFILNRIGGGQVFITCCEDGGIAARTGGKVLTVENGTIKEA